MTEAPTPIELVAFDHFQESVALFRRDLCLVYANGPMLAHLGKPKSEVLGKSLWELSPETKACALWDALRRVAATGVGERLEHAHRPFRGRFDSRLFATEQGVYLIAAELDSNSLAETEHERLDSLFQQSPAAIAVITAPDWVFEFSNAKNDELAGRGPLVGRNVYEAMPELVSQGFAHLLDLIYRTNETFDDVEVKLNVGTAESPREIYLNGTYQPIVNSEGKIDRIAAFVHDVTEKVKARQRIEALAEELAVSEARARRLQDSGVIGVVFWTRDGKVIDANDAFLKMVGYTRDELLSGQVSWTEMTPPEFTYLDTHAFVEMEATGICTPYEKIFIGKHGQRIPILIGIAFWEGSTDSGVGWILDVSARRAVEAERDSLLERERLARAQAEQANRSKDEFLAMVSHELRTPLNAMLGWARMLSAGNPDSARQKRGLEVIERNAIAQAQLIEDLLDVSRIVHGKLRLEVASIDFYAVVEAAVDSVRPGFESKGLHLSVNWEPNLDRILGDAQRLQQVVWNLLSNSAKFTPKGGHVHVELRKVGAAVELSVTDTGRGIAPSALPFVFERFRQADASITRSYGGLGLGLSIAQHLVELHGGSIEAKSDGEGKGARFIMTLGGTPLSNLGPRTLQATLPPRTTVAELTSELCGLRVLVVDDEPDARELTSAILSEGGATVIAATSASHALRLLDEQPLDVMLSDIGMPEQDGYELIRRVRQLAGPVAQIPAAALTAFARTEERRQAMLAGFQLHISKPVEPTELTAAVACLARLGNVRP
ncbi:MAG TPA: ATP-binding protein [Polyangiaceae bacterium]|nr:ATP-binding protein [Polyangiaceae bacterium]